MVCLLTTTATSGYGAEPQAEGPPLAFLEFLGTLVEEDGALLDPMEVFGELEAFDEATGADTKTEAETVPTSSPDAEPVR